VSLRRRGLTDRPDEVTLGMALAIMAFGVLGAATVAVAIAVLL
jgi:hypothetical protein